MTKSYYLPKAEKDKLAWFNTFNTVLAGLATILGFTAAEIAAINADYLAVKYIADMLDVFKVEMLERTRYKDLLHEGDPGISLGEMPTVPVLPVPPAAVKAGVFKRLGKTVQRIKAHPEYNEAMGRNLGIIGPEQLVDIETISPVIALKSVSPSGVKIKFSKGEMEAVAVFSRINVITENTEGSTPVNETTEETEWVEIARVVHTPFIDTRLNKSNSPENRSYKMRFIKNDQLVGQDSLVLDVVATTYKSGADLANKLK